MTARRFPPPWSVEELDACFIVTDSAEVLREANLMIKPLCHVLFAGALCLVGIDNINSANAQQTDQQTIVPKVEAALAAKIKCRDFRKNANGTWTSRPNTKIGANAFPAHTFDIHGVSIGGADLATVLNRKCGVTPQVRPQNRPPPSIPTETPGQTSPEPSPPSNSQESPQPNGDEQTPDGSR